MKPKRAVFITGATGFLGSYLLKLFLENGNKAYALARSKADKSARERIIDMLHFWDGAIPDKGYLKHLEVVEGDIIFPGLGMRPESDIKRIISEVEIIFHSAALAELRTPLEVIRKINAEGTRNVLDFALICRENGRLLKVNHISTAYVAGDKNGIDFSEDMLELGQGFHNTYEQTKYEAELIVKEYIQKGLNISIFRPSMVMGASTDGKTNNFRLFYEPLHFFAHSVYDIFPANLKCFQNFINIDTVAKALFLLFEYPKPRVFHLISPGNISIGFLMKSAANYFKFKMPKCIPEEKFDFEGLTPAQKALAQPYLPYFNYNTNFLSKETQGILKEYDFRFPKIEKRNLTRIFQYCDRVGFIKIRN